MRAINKYKTTIGLALVTVLFLTGTAYGVWTDTTNIRGRLTTGNFSVEFARGKQISADLISPDGKVITKQGLNTNSFFKDDKNLSGSISGELLNLLKTDGVMLRVKCPIKTTNDSKIKAIKTFAADFNKPDHTLEVIPDSIKVVIGKEFLTFDDINKEDFKITLNIYKQIEKIKGNYYAMIFLEVVDYNKNPDLVPIDYKMLTKNLSKVPDIACDTPFIKARINAMYWVNIPIELDQFNAGKTI